MPDFVETAARVLRSLLGRTPAEPPPRFAGRPVTATGLQALLEVDPAQALWIATETGEAVLPPTACKLPAAAGLLEALGAAETGLRVTVALDAAALAQALPAVRDAAARHLPLVIITVLGGRHEALAELAEAGALLLVARDAQEAVDLAVVGRQVAERALTPVLVAVEAEIALTPVPLSLPEAALIDEILGQPGDRIEAPTEAQAIVFGHLRRRVPRRFDLAHPRTLGAVAKARHLPALRAASDVLWADPVLETVEKAFSAWQGLTGRTLATTVGTLLDGAAQALVAVGPAIPLAQTVGAGLRAEDLRVGVLGLTCLRPLPVEALRAALGRCERVVVLERGERGLQGATPLFRDLHAALGEAGPRLVPVVLPGAGAPVEALAGLVRNPPTDPGPFYLGVPSLAERSAFPRREAMRQALLRGHPALGARTLAAGRTLGTRPEPKAVPAEPVVPPVVRRLAERDADLARFWGEVVQPRLAGDLGNFPDPWQSGAMLPALSAACFDRSADRQESPALDPRACTGCGKCWTNCPDSAIGVTLLPTEAWLEAALQRVSPRSAGLDKIKRTLKQVAARTDGILARTGARTVTAQALAEAWGAGLDKLAGNDEERATLTAAFEATVSQALLTPLATTEAFFHAPHGRDKGTGLHLALAVDPSTCQGCGGCVAVCANSALTLVPDTTERLTLQQEIWTAWEEMPDTAGPVLARVTGQPLDRLAATLLSRHCQRAVVGADGAEPGSGARLSLRLVVAMAEQHLQKRALAWQKTLTGQVDQLRQAARSLVAEAAVDADLGALEEALTSPNPLAKGTDGAGRSQRLAAVLQRMEAQGQERRVDARRLAQLAHAGHALQELAEGLGTRARLGVVLGGERICSWAGQFPRTSLACPALVEPTGRALTLALGLARGLAAEAVAQARTQRLAALALEGVADLPARELALTKLSWQDLTAQERENCPPVLVFADPTALDGDGLQGLTRVLASDLPVQVVLLDPRDGSPGPDPTLLGLAHRQAFVLASTFAAPEHLATGLEAALSWHGPTLVHLHAPSPQGQGFAPRELVPVAEKALQTRDHPLVVYDPRKAGVFGLRLDLAGNPPADQTQEAPTWATLQEWAGIVTPFTARVRAEIEAEVRTAHAKEIAQLEDRHAAELAAVATRQQAETARRLRDRLLQLAAAHPGARTPEPAALGPHHALQEAGGRP